MLDALSIDLTPVVAEQPDPLLFATVSGAHLGQQGRRAPAPRLPEAPPYLAALIEAKAAAEHGGYEGPPVGGVREDFEALHAMLDAAQAASALPEQAAAYDALDEFVVRRRTLRG
ncbi:MULTISPECIES: hypothetical protein [Streptomyces]|uniref:hypothetical protein n=1 Tax=Streptomyces TaxID=1883 RepID=UPI0036905C69